MKQNNPDNDSWMKAFRKGSSQAFDNIFNHYYPRLCYFAEKMLSDEQDARDIASDTLVKCWNKREDFEQLHSLQSFLYVTTRNACLDFLKHEKRKIASHNELKYLSEQYNEEDFLNDIIETEVTDVVLAQIESLPKKCRIIFKMIYFERLSTEDIAEKLHISKRNVLNQKARAIDLLKTVLAKRNLLMILLCLQMLKNTN